MSLTISGYASRFNECDLGRDTVKAGAFSASLLARPAPRPMLYGHQTDTPIGVWDRLVEDATGLFVEGRIQAGSPLADRVIDLVASGAVTGLSIGYRLVRARGDTSTGAEGRQLYELDLWEVSVVAFPMLPTARITSVASTDTLQSTTPERNAA